MFSRDWQRSTTACQKGKLKIKCLPVTALHHQILCVYYFIFVVFVHLITSTYIRQPENGGLLCRTQWSRWPRGVSWPRGPCEQSTGIPLWLAKRPINTAKRHSVIHSVSPDALVLLRSMLSTKQEGIMYVSPLHQPNTFPWCCIESFCVDIQVQLCWSI